MNYLRRLALVLLLLCFATPALAAPPVQRPEVQAFLDGQPGVLKTYLDDNRPAAFHIESASAYYGISPRLHLALLEATNRLISDPAPSQMALHQPYGSSGPAGFALQIEWASRELRAGLGPYTRPPTLRFTDGTTTTLSISQAPEGVAVQRFLAIGRSQSDWRSLVVRFNDAFLRYFNNELPPSASPAPSATSGFLQLPWRSGTPMVHLAYFDHVYPTVDTGGDGNNAVVNYLGQGGVQYNRHDGHDFYFPSQPIGTPIMAAASGIAYARTERGNGVVIMHDSGYETVYWHLNEFAPIFRGLIDSSQGVAVVAGQQLGTSGRSGFVQGTPHLHFEVRHNGRQVDPYGWYGPGTDPCAAYIACEASTWLWDGRLAGQYDLTPPDATALVDTVPPEATLTVNPRDDLMFLARFDSTALPDVGTGLPFTFGDANWTAGRWGQGLRVNTSAELSYPTEGNLPLPRGTLGFWAQLPASYASTSSGRSYLLAASANVDDPSRIYTGTLALRRERQPDGNAAWNFWTVGADGVSNNLVAPDTLGAGWHHFALAWDAAKGSKALYLDGKLAASAQAVALPKDVGPLLELGRFTSGGAPSGVIFDELAIFNKTWTPAEISKLAGSTEPLVASAGRLASSSAPPTVALDLNAHDRQSGVQTVQVGVDGDWSDPVPYEDRLRWPLPAVEGMYTIAVRFLDRAGNSTVLSSSVLLDLPPQGSGQIRHDNGIRATVALKVSDKAAECSTFIRQRPLAAFRLHAWLALGFSTPRSVCALPQSQRAGLLPDQPFRSQHHLFTLHKSLSFVLLVCSNRVAIAHAPRIPKCHHSLTRKRICVILPETCKRVSSKAYSAFCIQPFAFCIQH